MMPIVRQLERIMHASFCAYNHVAQVSTMMKVMLAPCEVMDTLGALEDHVVSKEHTTTEERQLLFRKH